jgi:hypothetical protein
MKYERPTISPPPLLEMSHPVLIDSTCCDKHHIHTSTGRHVAVTFNISPHDDERGLRRLEAWYVLRQTPHSHSPRCRHLQYITSRRRKGLETSRGLVCVATNTTFTLRRVATLPSPSIYHLTTTKGARDVSRPGMFSLSLSVLLY